ncbi:MAG: helix-turn-helix transcriptional regulator [Candidatus Ornithospirochaeta sp.]|nr:helix-turn-helix transcriptional regulator [Candidatus Ornithospirochaeta sp.]
MIFGPRTRKLRILFFIGLLAINLASLLVLSLFNYRFFYLEEEKAFEAKFYDSAAKETDMYVENIDLQLKAMIAIPSLYFSSTTDNYYLLYPESNKTVGDAAMIRNITMLLSRIHAMYPYLYSMDIYYRGTGTVITSFAYAHETESMDEAIRFIPWLSRIDEDMERSCFIEYDINSYPVRFSTITYVQRLNSNEKDDDDIYVALHIDPKLFEFPVRNYLVSSYFFDMEGNPVFRSSESSWQQEIIDSVKNNERSGKLIGHYENEDGKYILYSTDLASNLRFYGFLGYRSLYPGYSEDTGRLAKNFIFQIIFNLVCLGLLTIFNYRLYRFYIIGFFQDVVGRKGTLAEALESIGNAYETLDDRSRSYQHQEMLRLLLLNRATEDQYMEAYSEAEGDFIYTVIAEIAENESSIYITKAEAIAESMEERGIQVRFTTIASVSGIVFTVISASGSIDKEVIEAIRELGSSIRINAGRVFPLKQNGFQNSFSSAMDVVRYRFLDPVTDVLCNDELRLEEKTSFSSHVNMLMQIERAIKYRKTDSVEMLLDNLFGDLSSGDYSVQYCKATLDDLVTSIYNIFCQNRIDMWNLIGYDIRPYSKKIKDIASYRTWLENVISTAIGALCEADRKNESDTCRLINSIIDENLNNDISLGMLSEKLGIREDALSRSFKSLMGCNYMEFITEKKMKRAVELLHEGYAVQEIASELGYRSPQYFIKVFKSAFGITPHKYRISNAKEEQE